MHGPYQLLPLSGLLSQFSLFKVVADLDTTLDVPTGTVSLDWIQIIFDTTYSIASNILLKSSGRSLNFVDFVKGKAPGWFVLVVL